jgi:hypothetical protein
MDLSRAVMSGVLVSAISLGLGYMTNNRLDYMESALDGGLMAGSVVAADAVAISRFVPPIVPMSLVAGGVYAGGQWFVRKDKNVVVNVAVGGAADFLTDTFSG